MTDIIVVTYDDFYMKKNIEIHTDAKIKNIMTSIIANHECFSHNYRYVPHKDENYKQKLSNYIKKHKVSFVVEKNDKFVYSLLNKLSPSNYDIIKSKILESIEQVDIDVSIEKILQYSKKSNIYTNIICNIIQELNIKNTDVIHNIVNNFIAEYTKQYEIENYLKLFDDLNYDDYDDFCDHHKKELMMYNMLNTIIQVTKTIYLQNNEICKDIFDKHINSITYYYENEVKHFHINKILFELFNHVELIINTTDLLETIDTSPFNILCQNIIAIANNKLKFKVTDIIEKL